MYGGRLFLRRGEPDADMDSVVYFPSQLKEILMFGKPNKELYEVIDAIPAARPAVQSSRLAAQRLAPTAEQELAEYAELAAAVGVAAPDLNIRQFEAVLHRLDFPVFSLPAVVKYMDEKAAKESKERAGWEWRPLREKDDLVGLRFGKRAERNYSGEREIITNPASDYFVGSNVVKAGSHGGGQGQIWPAVDTLSGRSSSPYDRTIPLHALRRVARIEKEYQGPVAFFVSDYALAPAIQYPDPFLMAVVPNLNVKNGTGRFVIDFWDEPGFGIEQMLK
jgi:hypothetical protein